MNIRFNRLRVSHSLPDLSKQESTHPAEENIKENISATSQPPDRSEKSETKPVTEKSENHTPDRKFVPISSAPPPESNDIIFAKPVVPISYRVRMVPLNTVPSHNKHIFVRPKKVCLL